MGKTVQRRRQLVMDPRARLVLRDRTLRERTRLPGLYTSPLALLEEPKARVFFFYCHWQAGAGYHDDGPHWQV